MKRSNIMKLRIKPIVAACALAMAAGQAGAIDYYLAAKQYNKVLMPGTPLETTVPMWGYVFDPDNDTNNVGDCYEAGNATARQSCVDALPDDPTVPGPQLSMPSTDNQLRIFLSNGLPEATSIVVPGQELPWSDNNNGPTFVRPNGTLRLGNRNNPNQKMRSYGREAAANGGNRSYRWTNFRANPINDTGTFIYHTGTHPQKQLYMGLVGTVTRDFIPGEVYEGVPYAFDTTLFYSDIDPDFNKSVVSAYDQAPYAPNDYSLTHTPLETAIERHPSWFLINGEPYVPGTTPDILGMATNQPNLIRFASAATEKHVPVLQGHYGTIHGEDGIQYNWQDSAANTTTPAPIQQYSIGLPPLKTKDVIVNPAVADRFAIYDGNGYMTNPSDPDNPDDNGDTVGGMLRFLNVAVGANQPPVAVADVIEIGVPEIYDSGNPFFQTLEIVDVLANDSDPDLNDIINVTDSTATDTASITNTSIVFSCSSTNSNCDFTVNYNGLFQGFPAATGGPVQFQYEISDGSIASTSTVDLTLVLNTAPVFSTTPLQIYLSDLTNDIYTFNLTDVVAGATDAEGDTATVIDSTLSPTDTLLTCNYTTGECSYDFSTLVGGLPTDQQVDLTYTATDGTNIVANVPFTIILSELGAPTATADSFTLDQIATANLLANDLDPLGDPIVLPQTTFTTALVSGPVDTGASVTVNSDGTFTYTPSGTFTGDSFTYAVTDTGTNTVSAEATVTIPSGLLVASAESYTMIEDSILDVAAAGVLANEVPVNGGTLEAILDTPPSCDIGGTFALNSDGSFHYEPLLDWNSELPAVNGICDQDDGNGLTGVDSFSYFVRETHSGGTTDSNVVTAEITVTPTNDPPVANNVLLYLQDATTTNLDPEGQTLDTTFSIPAPGVLGNVTNLENDGITAAEANDPDNNDPAISADGAVSPILIEGSNVGILGSVSFVASDVHGAVSNTAQADFVRLVTLTQSDYLERGNANPANDDWRIAGIVDPSISTSSGTTAVNAWLQRRDTNGVLIEELPIIPTATNANNGRIRNSGGIRIFTLNANNIGNTLMPGPNDTLRVQIDSTNPNVTISNPDYDINEAVYTGYPVNIIP